MKRRTFLQLAGGFITGALGAITLSGLGPYRRTSTSASSKPSAGGQSGLPNGLDHGNQGRGVDELPARPANLEAPKDSSEQRMTPIGDGDYTVLTYDRNGNITGKKTFRPDRR